MCWHVPDMGDCHDESGSEEAGQGEHGIGCSCDGHVASGRWNGGPASHDGCSRCQDLECGQSWSAFDPPTLPIQVVDTVVWTNDDGLSHTVTSTDDTGELNSVNQAFGATYAHQLETIGLLTRRWEIHASMTGSV